MTRIHPNPAARKAWHAARRAELLAAGLCPNCQGPLPAGWRSCEACRDKGRERARPVGCLKCGALGHRAATCGRQAEPLRCHRCKGKPVGHRCTDPRLDPLGISTFSVLL